MSAARKRESWSRRTWQRVRRESLPSGGGWEEGYRCKLNRRELLQVRIAAERLDIRSRKRGRRNGVVGGYVALRVLGLFANLARKHGGWVAIGAVEIARLVGCSYSAVRRALSALKLAKVVAWARRWREAEDKADNPRGLSVEQDCNLYRLDFPAEARRELGLGAPTAPDDELQRRADRDAERRRCHADEPTGPGGRSLRGALDRLSLHVVGGGDRAASPT
jgi:hypothetical protein